MDQRRPLLGGLALTGVAVAALLGVYLHLRLSATVSPIRQTVSDYVLAPDGAATFAAMCLSLALGSLGLVSAVIGLRPYPATSPRATRGGPGAARAPHLRGPAREGSAARGHVIALLLSAWCLGLMVAALFPTDPMSGPMSPAGEAHRWAIVLAFVSLPAAGWLLSGTGAHAWTPYAGALRFWSRTAFASLGFLMITYVPVVFPGVMSGPVIIGLSERLVLFVHLALLVTLARPLVRPAPAPIRSAPNTAELREQPGFVTPDA